MDCVKIQRIGLQKVGIQRVGLFQIGSKCRKSGGGGSVVPSEYLKLNIGKLNVNKLK